MENEQEDECTRGQLKQSQNPKMLQLILRKHVKDDGGIQKHKGNCAEREVDERQGARAVGHLVEAERVDEELQPGDRGREPRERERWAHGKAEHLYRDMSRWASEEEK